MKTLVAAFFLFFSLTLFSQGKYPFEKWTKEKYAEANTAKDSKTLSPLLQKFIFLSNLARINPELFFETYAKRYIDSLGLGSSNYVKTLEVTMRTIKPVRVLKPADDLSKSAELWALESGKKGEVGHGDFKKRYNAVSKVYFSFGENCDYGKKDALGYLMAFLIDEGVASLIHRENMLSENYGYVGLFEGDHKKYGKCLVVDFGDKR